MKKCLKLLFILLLHAVVVKAQKSDILYFDEDLNIVKKSKAMYAGKSTKVNGLYRVDFFDKDLKRLSHTFHYADSTMQQLQGLHIYYDRMGNKKYEGYYAASKKEGVWLEYAEDGTLTDSVVYIKDKIFTDVKLHYSQDGRLLYRSIKDSLTNTLYTTSYDSTGKIVNRVSFTGNEGEMIKYTNEGEEKIKLTTREEIDAEFPGGQVAWRLYLQKNLNANIPINNGAKRGAYRVIIRFIVTKDGSVTDIVPETSFGFGMEEEAMRIIRSSPKWIPASQFGRKVNAYRRQPIAFVVS